MSIDHPFQPGTMVAVRLHGRRFGFEPVQWRHDEVLKVHKNGNFTLKSDPKQQWRGLCARPAYNGKKMEIAEGFGAGQHYGRLNLLSDVIDQVHKDNEAHDRWERWKKIEAIMDRLSYERVTDEALASFEIAVSALKPKEPK